MKKRATIVRLLTAACVLTLGVGVADAQTPADPAAQTPATQATTTGPKSYVIVDINGGGQFASHTLNTSGSQAMFGESATYTTAQNIPNAPVIDGRFGVRVWNRVAVGIDLSTSWSTSTGSVSASIPNPLIFGQPTITNYTVGNLKHSEIGTHLQAIYILPVNDKIDVTLAAGPSFIRLSQDVPVVVINPNTATATVSATNQSKLGYGGNIAVDGNYLITPTMGIGVYLRYAGASVDLPSQSGVKVGGFQAGGGLRIRF